MSSTPKDRNIIETTGRSPATEDEVYRILDIKDFTSVSSAVGDEIVVSPGSTISITNYPIYEELLQLPPLMFGDEWSIRPSVFGTRQRPWAIIDGTSFGWYARTLLTTIVKSGNYEETIAINLDDTSESTQLPIGNVGVIPHEDFVNRGGYIYSGFAKLNQAVPSFDQDTTFTVLLPNGQLGTTTFTSTTFSNGFKTDQYVYLSSYFTATAGSGVYLCRINKTGTFNMEALYLLEATSQPSKVIAVYDTHVWWSGGASMRTLKKYDVSLNTNSTYSDYVAFSEKDIFWPQADGTVAWFNGAWTSGGDFQLTLKWISLGGVVTTEPFPIVFPADPSFSTTGPIDTIFKESTNEYFVTYIDIYSKETTVINFINFVPFTTGSILDYGVLTFPSKVTVDLRWSVDNYGIKARWLGSDATQTIWAFYEMSV